MTTEPHPDADLTVKDDRDSVSVRQTFPQLAGEGNLPNQELENLQTVAPVSDKIHPDDRTMVDEATAHVTSDTGARETGARVSGDVDPEAIEVERKVRYRDEHPGVFATLMILLGMLLAAVIIFTWPLYLILTRN